MKKTIPIEKIRIGMFIVSLEGSWLDHPFWKKAFLLEDEKDLKILKESLIKAVVIDISKGLDIEVEAPQTNEAMKPAPTESSSDTQSSPKKTNAELMTKPRRVSAENERSQAKRIINSSKAVVSSMLQEARMGNAVNIESAALPLVEEISESLARNESALISLVRLKSQDDYSYMHSVSVCALMVALARELKLSDSEIKQAGLAGLIHDVGKVAIPLTILNKPGALSNEEFDLVKQHPVKGHEILLRSSFKDTVALDVCLHHHEKLDGSGYPHRLSGDQISLFARMGAVADVYDAITSDRPYKKGWAPGVSLQRMAGWKGHFDEDVFKAFVKCVGIYPVGSAVILKSGRLAVVIDQSHKSLLTPIVKVFFSTKSGVRLPVEVIDLSKPNVNDKIVGHEDPVLFGIHDFNQLWAGN